MIFDTNILTYISKNTLSITDLMPLNSNAKISIISYIEAMGFAFDSENVQAYMQRICASCQIITLSDAIVGQTIILRKSSRIKLPDALIYAIALVEGGPLMTNNISDFKALGNKVELINPFHL